jgi:hypothetical protein
VVNNTLPVSHADLPEPFAAACALQAANAALHASNQDLKSRWEAATQKLELTLSSSVGTASSALDTAAAHSWSVEASAGPPASRAEAHSTPTARAMPAGMVQPLSPNQAYHITTPDSMPSRKLEPGHQLAHLQQQPLTLGGQDTPSRRSGWLGLLWSRQQRPQKRVRVNGLI